FLCGSLLVLGVTRRRGPCRFGLPVLLLFLRLRLFQERDGSTGLLDLLAGRGRDCVHTNDQLLLQVTVPEQLDVGLRVLEQPDLDEALGGDFRTVLEAVERADVDGCSGRPEWPDRHRVLRRRAALFAQPHIDRHLAAFEPGAHLVGARAGLLALDAAAGVAALAGADATTDALPVFPALRGLQGGEVELGSPGR